MLNYYCTPDSDIYIYYYFRGQLKYPGMFKCLLCMFMLYKQYPHHHAIGRSLILLPTSNTITASISLKLRQMKLYDCGILS